MVTQRLPVLCAQEYLGAEMRIVPCERTKCGNWNKQDGRCTVATGAEHFPLVEDPPVCPIQDRCQHQIQAGLQPCPVRSRGMICESALGDPEHPLAFHALTIAGPDEL